VQEGAGPIRHQDKRHYAYPIAAARLRRPKACKAGSDIGVDVLWLGIELKHGRTISKRRGNSMIYGKKLAGMALAVMIGMATPGTAAASDADIIRQAEDRTQIEALMWNYVRAIDSFNPEAYVSVFTPDGSFGATKGSEALRKMVADLKKSQDDRRAKGEQILAMHHIVTNASIEFVGENQARYHYYWMTVFGGAAGVEPAPRVAAVGRGVDDVVRVNGKWLIKTRNVAPTD
jgi:hypothetical protein